MAKKEPISLENNDLREGAALFSRPDLGVALFRGEDRKEFLHRLLTSAVKKLSPGESQPSLLLDPRGKILAKILLLDRAQDTLALVEASGTARLIESLKRYHFCERIEMEDVTATFSVFSLRGSKAKEALTSFASNDAERAHNPAEQGWEIVLPAGKKPTMPLGSAEQLELWRMESGIARYGVEIDESCYPQEARWEGLCANDKGCYIGQETVARMNTYGKPPRLLVGLARGGARAPLPARGSALLHQENPVGALRSAICSPWLGATIGLGLVKSELAGEGQILEIQGWGRAIVVPTPFSKPSLGRYLTLLDS